MGMSLEEKIAAYLVQAAEQPAASKLEPYTELVRSLRQKRWTYQRIAMALRDDFGLKVAPSTIHAFVKVRSKRSVAPARPSAEAFSPQPKVPAKRRFNLDA